MPARKSPARRPEEKGTLRGGQTRAGLVSAAYELFLEHGFHGTSMRQIAQRAGLALGGIYNHFTSKEEVFVAVLMAYHPYHEMIPAIAQARGATAEEFFRS